MTPFTPTFPTMPTANSTGTPIENLNSSVTIEASDRGTPTLLDADITMPQGWVGLAAMTAFATITISGLEAGDSLTVDSGLPTGWRPGTGNTLVAPTGITASATVSQTGGTVTISLMSPGFVASAVETLIESLRFSTTDASVSGSRTLNIFVDSNMDLSGTVGVTLAAAPVPVQIEGLDDLTIPFETRFVRNLIDGDITLPANMVKDLDEGMWSLNGLVLSITGLQFGDAIRLAAGSGFTFAYGPSGVTLNGQPFATASGNTSSATFTFTTNVTAAQLEQFLEALTFQAGPANPAQTSRTLSYSLNSPTPLTGSVALTLEAPLADNQIQDLDNQTVLVTDSAVRLDSAITLSDAFIEAYSSAGSLNNSTISVTGWTGMTAPIRFASDTGVSVEVVFETFHKIFVDGVWMGSYNPFGGTIGLTENATAATVETLIEAISINPQLTTEAPSRTFTVTVVTPTLPQHGTVTFTGTTVLLNDLRETVDVSYLDASGRGVYFDSDVTLAGDGPWANGQLQVTGLFAGDNLEVIPREGVHGFGFNPETGAVVVVRNQSLIDVANVTARTDTGLTFTFNGNTTRADIETLIENLFFYTDTSGTRNIQITVSDQSGAKTTGSIALNVGYIPTLTDMVDTLDLTAEEAAAGTLLDADVTFKGSESFDGGGISISGAVDGDSITLRTGDGSPISLEATEEGTSILIGNRTVGVLYGDEAGLQIATNDGATAADIEAILENLVFRTTGTGATRDFTIQITDRNGDFDKQVITVNLLPAGAKELAYQIFTVDNGTLLPIQGLSGTTGDLNPADLFGPLPLPNMFVVEYSGLLSVGTVGFGERSYIYYEGASPDTVFYVNGVYYTAEGSQGRIELDLPPGLHKITLMLPYETNNGTIVTKPPTLTFGTGLGSAPVEEINPTPLFDSVRTMPDSLHKVTVTSSITNDLGTSEQTHVFYVTSLDDISALLIELKQMINPPPGVTFTQTYTTVTETAGGTGADTLVGTVGNDLLEGGAGDDVLMGSPGADTMDGGAGVDAVSYQRSGVGVVVDLTRGIGLGGDAEGDVLRNIEVVTGSGHADRLIGSAGNDTLRGLAGHDTLIGRAGDDVLSGGDGGDLLEGGAGNDLMRGGFGGDGLYGGDGVDSLFGESGNDTLGGFNGDDKMFGGAGDDLLRAGEGNDALHGDEGADQLFGGDGDDRLMGGAGADMLDGGTGFNWASYARSVAGVTVDLFKGVGQGGEAEGDVLLNIRGVNGSMHDDLLVGSARRDLLNGAAGNDTLNGGGGADSLFGGAGDDLVTGGDGHDRLNGGAGNDVLTGGAGDDVFVFQTGFGADQITDLSEGDGILLQKEQWGSSGVGNVADLLENRGYQFDGYVELRLTATDVLRIDGVTLVDLRSNPDYFLIVQ